MSNKRKRSIMDILDNYYEELEEQFERWREMVTERPSWNQKACTMEPLRHVRVTPTEVIVTADLPLTKENSIQVKPVDKSTIEILASMKRKIRFTDFGITHHKGEFQKLHCHLRVPVPVYMEKMELCFKKGILEIRLPRKHEYKVPIE
jgi:HSP20 family molecular chaperone IbpA